MTIRQYFKNGAQLGIATGHESGLFVLDVDIRPDKNVDGRIALVELEQRPSRRQLDEAHDAEPVFPAGEPSDRWSATELRAYAEQTDRLAAEQAA